MSILESWFRTYYAPLTAFAWKLVGSQEYAEEIVQQLFVSLYEKGDQLPSPDSPKAYLYQAVRNRCLNHLKKSQRKQSQETPLEGISERGSRYDDPLEATEFEAQLYAWIEALPPACREVFRLSRFESKSNAEIAELLGISKRTVETQISKALKLLRARLREIDLDQSSKLRLISLLAATILGLHSCQKPIPYTGPLIQPRLVVDSRFQPDSAWELSLFQTQDMNDSAEERRVLDARVLIEGATWEAEMELSGETYRLLDPKPAEGERYTLSIFADGLGSVFAVDTVPFAPSFQVLDTLTNVVSGQRALIIEVNLTPHPQTAYHFIEAAQLIRYEEDSIDVVQLFLADLDEQIDNEGLGIIDGYFPRLFVPGENWQGEVQRLRFAVGLSIFPIGSISPTSPESAIRLTISGVSKAYYDHQRGLSRYLTSSNLSVLTQTLAIPTNIQQGLGLFGAYSPETYVLELE